jgi:hypothetical protein
MAKRVEATPGKTLRQNVRNPGRTFAIDKSKHSVVEIRRCFLDYTIAIVRRSAVEIFEACDKYDWNMLVEQPDAVIEFETHPIREPDIKNDAIEDLLSYELKSL